MSEGFARNMIKIFGPGSLYRGLGDRPLKSVTLSDDKEVVTFAFADAEAPEVRFGAEGDCCSHSWIEHLEAPENVLGRVVVAVDDCSMDRSDDGDEYEVTQVYQTVFRLDNGESIKIEYRNTSNGYYGGYLVRLDPQGNRDYDDD